MRVSVRRRSIGVIERPRIETFALSDGAAAHARLEDRRFSGKIVLLPE
ncbi:hypothetical protein [Ensifer sp. LC163]|nr:hypothetical protein [Ensifer sp. LC163]